MSNAVISKAEPSAQRLPLAVPSPDLAVSLPKSAFPYESEAFHQCWWTNLAPKFDIPFKGKDLLIHRKTMAKGLLRLHEARIAGWNNAWNQELTTERVSELEQLSQTSSWDYFKVVFSEEQRPEAALSLLRRKGYPMLEVDAPVQYSVDMQDGFDGYLKGLSHNSRKSLKKKTRRGQELNPQLVPVHDAEGIDGFFAELFLHHIAYWDEKAGGSYFNDAEERHFIVNWAKALHQSGQLVLERLLLNGETANLSMGIRVGEHFYWLLTINTGLHSEYVPGIISLYMRLEQLAAQGVTRFHMGAGDYFYKVQAANRKQTCRELLVANPKSLKGQLLLHWRTRQVEKARKLAEQQPSSESTGSDD